MKAALAGVLIAWLCLLQGAYGAANLGPEVTDPANFLPTRILIRADVTTSIKPSRPQTLGGQAIASALPLFLSREPLGESESLNLYSYCHNDPVNYVDVLGLAEAAINDASENWASRKFREFVFGMFPTMGAMASRRPQDQAFYIQSAHFQNNVSVPMLRFPGQAIQATGNALTEGATNWGGNRIAGGNSISGYGGGVTGGIAGQFVSGVGGMLDPIGMIDAGQDYFIVQANDVWRNSGGGWNGFQAVARHDLTAWNVEKAYNGFASGDHVRGWEGVGATASTALIFLAPQMQASRLPIGAGPMARTSTAGIAWWQRGMYLRVPAEMYSGVPRLQFSWGAYLRGLIGDPPAGMIDPHAHHILYKRGNGLAQQQLVAEGQAILRRVGIDPIYGPENLTWAPWRVVEQHGPGPLGSLVDDLRRLEAIGGEYDDFVQLLNRYGNAAKARR